MSYHPALLKGLALRLQAAGLGVYAADGVFTSDQRGIVIHAYPEQPPEIVALSLYLPGGVALSPTATRRLSTARVQIRYRVIGHPFAGIEYFDQLHDLIDQKALDLGGIHVGGEYLSFSEIGQTRQPQGGFEFTTNWKLTGLADLPLVPSAG
jgi:hypothetical protein